MKITALIMAGGKGQRFWPKSRIRKPKQFLSLTDDGKTMIQLTVERIRPLVEVEDIFVVTNDTYKELVLEQLSCIPSENIICEPMGKNTAPCIGLGAVHLLNKYGEDTIMIVLAADHIVKNNDEFINTLKETCECAKEGENLVTIGIEPNYPETGYGYIKYKKKDNYYEKDGKLDRSVFYNGYVVERFVEKPNLEQAKVYINEGDFLWNSGMFVWKVSSILKNIEKYMPFMYKGLMNIYNALQDSVDNVNEIIYREYREFDSESIDYGIMEKAHNIIIFNGKFGWDDVGSWLAISRMRDLDEDNNVVSGNVISIDTTNCIIESEKKLIATVGLKNMVVIESDDVVLIANKDNVGNIKEVLTKLKDSNRDEYL